MSGAHQLEKADLVILLTRSRIRSIMSFLQVLYSSYAASRTIMNYFTGN